MNMSFAGPSRVERCCTRMCHHRDGHFPLEYPCQPPGGPVAPLHHVFRRVTQEECDISLADALSSGHFLDSDCHFY